MPRDSRATHPVRTIETCFRCGSTDSTFRCCTAARPSIRRQNAKLSCNQNNSSREVVSAMSSPLQSFSDRVLFGMLSEAPDLALNLGISEVAGQALPDAGLPDFSEEGVDRRARLMDACALELDPLPHAQ